MPLLQHFQLLTCKLGEGQLCPRRQTILEMVYASHLALYFFKFQASADENILVPEVNASPGWILLPPRGMNLHQRAAGYFCSLNLHCCQK